MLENAFLDFGYTKEEFERIRNTYPINTLKDETLLNNFGNITKFLLNNGYTKEEAIKMSSKFPQLFSLSIENIKQKIDDMVSLGYTREEVIKMTKTSPTLFSYSIENIRQKMNAIMALGYTKEEVIHMIVTFPALISTSIESIREKINFYDSIDMHELPIVNPKELMQSTKLSYARYEFYKVKGMKINMTNYKRLFLGNKLFEKQYGITKEEILDKYKYEDYIKNKSKTK